MNWERAGSMVRWNIRPFVDGDYRTSASAESFEKVNPATELPLCSMPVGKADDIDDAVRVARKRFQQGCWSGLAPSRRAEILGRLADLIIQHKTELALLDTLEMGKPISASLYDVEFIAPALLRSWAGFADKLVGSIAPSNGRALTFNLYEPRGVIGAITPWNFPAVNAVFKFGPALAAGNTVVLKPSEVASSSALRIAELAVQAGIPSGVLNVVPGLGATVGVALAEHPGVNLLSFTGSTTTGRKILELSGRSNVRPVLLECGGKSPQVVFPDVDDLEGVARAVTHSVLWNQGQVCSAHTRLIVHESIRAQLLEKVIVRASQQRPADPLDPKTTFGPLASPAQRNRVKWYIDQGIEAGAIAVLRGSVQQTGGCYVAPTVFDRVHSSMTIAREEIFGPVLCVQTFESEEEAVALANGTDYGLEATVWTRDLGRATRLAHSLETGTVTVRTSGVETTEEGYRLGSEPRKDSGFGAESGLKGLESYSTLKRVNFLGETI